MFNDLNIKSLQLHFPFQQFEAKFSSHILSISSLMDALE